MITALKHTAKKDIEELQINKEDVQIISICQTCQKSSINYKQNLII